MIDKLVAGKFWLLILLVLATLMIITGAASAEWVLTNNLNSWDNGANRWENGNVALWLNSNPQAFYHEIVSSNQDEFNGTTVPDACGTGNSTVYAGTAEIGLYHTDNSNGAAGFQSTDNYQLVSCDLDQSGGSNDSETPNTVLYTCTTDNNDGVIGRCEIANKDTVNNCNTGNCQDEITTMISINLDSDCDGNLDNGFDTDVCLYWTAEKPPFVAPFWTGNFQARITDAGGDKSVNFDVLGPTAVNLQNAAASGGGPWIVVTFLSTLFLFTALLLYRLKQSRSYIKRNS